MDREVHVTVSNPKVLLVDDSKFLRMVTERTLSKAGFEVITAADGEEALQAANDELPDIILLDIHSLRSLGGNGKGSAGKGPAGKRACSDSKALSAKDGGGPLCNCLLDNRSWNRGRTYGWPTGRMAELNGRTIDSRASKWMAEKFSPQR